ncbi:hypothetical protein CH063_02274, partial [Colletotrichum higginsianum]
TLPANANPPARFALPIPFTLSVLRTYTRSEAPCKDIDPTETFAVCRGTRQTGNVAMDTCSQL